jgi:asparagine synthase (glutamine-hydrolysing)
MTGWVSYKSNLEAQQDVMTNTMARRGPDAGGTWTDRHVALVHRRLAVIDLAGGTQPIQAEEGGRTIAPRVYTGEVYKFAELRDQLMRLGTLGRQSAHS